VNGVFGIMFKQIQPKLFLFAGPSATKHGPNSPDAIDEAELADENGPNEGRLPGEEPWMLAPKWNPGPPRGEELWMPEPN
jgi:hypothetical protein